MIKKKDKPKRGRGCSEKMHRSGGVQVTTARPFWYRSAGGKTERWEVDCWKSMQQRGENEHLD
jgi:hypothetical protein